MKSFGKVFAAAAMAGAIALASSPIASAAPQRVEIKPNCHVANAEGQQYMLVPNEGGDSYKLDDAHVETGNPSYINFDDANIKPGTYKLVKLNKSGESNPHTDCGATVEVEEPTPETTPVTPTTTEQETTSEETTSEVTTSETSTTTSTPVCEEKEPCPTTPKCEPAGSSCGSAIGLLPLILLLGSSGGSSGSSTWFLNNDGSTYVSSEDRVDEVPTPEEKEKSDEIKEEHADEIKEQGKKPAPEAPAKGAPAKGAPAKQAPESARGISANTGDNSAAQGLVALAIAAMLGVAAFATRRHFSA